MKKLLGLVLMLCAAIVLSVGTTGCTQKPKDKDKTKDTKGKDVDKTKDADKGKDVDKTKDADKLKDVDKTKDADKLKDVDKSKDADKTKDLDKTKDKDVDKGVKEKDVEVKFNKVDGEPVKVAKKGDTKIKVEITEKAAADLTLSAKVKDNDKLTGTGKIAKGETKGDLTITADDSKVGEFTADVTVSAEKTTGMTKIKLKVE